ncbi:Ig-like domain-containing protein [Massilia glaciei]|uniref:Big-1 domain-containing protein n=1 Tax=Massilia glaciei TaxID=1524097 RepID=A0A2U2I4Z8_9BURK|nr:Ig-like domain-containing protein [Massilia glaciei]PWF54836.1 hypothetical protein C7C56_004590 [Massilia glaciei]
MNKTDSTNTKRLPGLLAALACATLLAACGGGGGSPGQVGPIVPPTPGDPVTPVPVPGPKMTLVILDGAGNGITTLSGGQSAVVRVTVLGADDKAVPNAIVKFEASDATLVTFTPESASALTDAAGVAVVSLKPASFSSAGALSISASTVVGAKTAAAAKNIAVGAAPLTVGALRFSPLPPASLPAFSTASLVIPVTSGGAPASTANGLVLTSLCTGDGSASLVVGSLSNGQLSATYTNRGCLRVNDVITAAIGSSSASITIPVSAANIGTVKFVSSSVATSIVLKGSGGLGRSESAQLNFRVVDQQDTGLGGVNVAFTATTTTGGLTLSPLNATTDAQGNVSVTVSSGTIPTPVRVIAEATRNGVVMSGLSDTLVISTGLPIQKSLSLSADIYNIEGWSYDGEISRVTVRMADQYGNPVSDDTAVNLVAEGGAVGSSQIGACVTVDGGCTVNFRSQNFRPVNGRVSVLAYAQGIKTFNDANGDGQYTCKVYTKPDGTATTDPYRPLIDLCVKDQGEAYTAQGDAFLDTDFNKVYEADKGDLPFPYGHANYLSADSGRWGITYINSSIELILSGSVATMYWRHCTFAGVCNAWSTSPQRVIPNLHGPGCKSMVLEMRITDLHDNPMPFGTTVSSVDTGKVLPGTYAPNLITSTNAAGGTFHTVTVKPDDACSSDSFGVRVLTPKQNGSVFTFQSGPVAP